MDQTPPEQPSREPQDGSGSELISEQEVTEVLAEASKLACELARQLDGEEATPVPPAQADILSESPNVDQQLDDVDALLAITSDELSEAPTDKDAEPQLVPGGEEEVPAVPNFMDEFTQPVGESDDASDSMKQPVGDAVADAMKHDGAQAGPRPGVVGTGIVGVATDISPEPQIVAEDEPVAVLRGIIALKVREHLGKLASLAVSTGKGILARLFPVADRAVGVLEKTDRPFTWIKEPIRRGIGWLAIATLGTSVFVFLWTLI